MNEFVIFAFLTALLSYAALVFQRKRRFRKAINKLPGPDGHFIFGSLMEFRGVSRDKVIDIFDRHQELYGTLFRKWIGSHAVVVIGNAEDAEIHYSRTLVTLTDTNEEIEALSGTILTCRTNIDKSPFYYFLHPWLGTGLLTSTGAKWFERRKLLTPAFHFSILNKFFDTIVQSSNLLLEKLSAEEHSEKFNLGPYVNKCALDIICETAMGVKVNAQENDSEYANSIKKISETIVKRMLSLWLWFDPIFSLSSVFKTQQKILEVVHGFTRKVINQRKRERAKQTDDVSNDSEVKMTTRSKKAFLDSLLDVSEENGGKLSDADLQEEVDTFMFEGHDTVSVAVAWSIYLIGSHQDIQDKIYDELYTVFGSSDRDPTMNDIHQLKYLESAIKECLRLYPSVPSIARTLTKDMILGGYEIPAGALVEIQIYRIHRNGNYYAKPNDFDPEHFSPENASRRHPFAYVPFSAGPRNCIGQKFAMLEEKVLLSTLLRRYKFEALQKYEDVARTLELVLRPGNGVNVKISRR